MDVEVVRMSSKGQFVMPLSMRRRLKMRKGEKLMLVENKGTIVVRPVKELENLNEELYLMRLASKGWEQLKKGKVKKRSKEKFLQELSSW